MSDIRESRGVPAKRGMRVHDRNSKRYGTIKSAKRGYLMVILDGDKFASVYHPTWMLDYLDNDGNVIFSTKD